MPTAQGRLSFLVFNAVLFTVICIVPVLSFTVTNLIHSSSPISTETKFKLKTFLSPQKFTSSFSSPSSVIPEFSLSNFPSSFITPSKTTLYASSVRSREASRSSTRQGQARRRSSRRTKVRGKKSLAKRTNEEIQNLENEAKEGTSLTPKNRKRSNINKGLTKASFQKAQEKQAAEQREALAKKRDSSRRGRTTASELQRDKLSSSASSLRSSDGPSPIAIGSVAAAGGFGVLYMAKKWYTTRTNDLLDAFGTEMSGHTPNLQELYLCYNEYVYRVGPFQKKAMFAAYLTKVMQETSVTSNMIKSVDYTMSSLFNFQPTDVTPLITKEIFPSLKKKKDVMALTNLLFVMQRLLPRGEDTKDALLPIQRILKREYKTDDFGQFMFKFATDAYEIEVERLVQKGKLTNKSKKVPEGYKVLGLPEKVAYIIVAQVLEKYTVGEDGIVEFVDKDNAYADVRNHFKPKEEEKKMTKAQKRESKNKNMIVDDISAYTKDFIPIFKCNKCDHEIYVKNEAETFGPDFKCPMCKAPASAFSKLEKGSMSL